MKILIVMLVLTLILSIALTEQPEGAEERKKVMQYLCDQDPILCKDRKWMKGFN